MADIEQLYGYMYLRNAWRIILANDVSMNAELQAIKDRVTEYVFHVNPGNVAINTTQSSLVKFYPEVLSSTHVIVGFTLNVNASTTTDITLAIKYDGVLLLNMIQTLTFGWNVIAFPYIIPSVGTGKHTIEILASVGSGTIAVEPNKLNVFLQAQSILGASTLPPSLNILEEVLYEATNDGFVIDSCEAVLLTDTKIEITENVSYVAVNNGNVSTNVVIQLL